MTTFTRTPLLRLAGLRGPLAFLLAALLSGCGTHVCTLDARMGLYVVLDGATLDDEVSVLAASTSDDYSEELDCNLNEGVYECAGLQERPGSYAVTATVNGASQEQDVTLEDDGCHVVPQTITFEE